MYQKPVIPKMDVFTIVDIINQKKISDMFKSLEALLQAKPRSNEAIISKIDEIQQALPQNIMTEIEINTISLIESVNALDALLKKSEFNANLAYAAGLILPFVTFIACVLLSVFFAPHLLILLIITCELVPLAMIKLARSAFTYVQTAYETDISKAKELTNNLALVTFTRYLNDLNSQCMTSPLSQENNLGHSYEAGLTLFPPVNSDSNTNKENSELKKKPSGDSGSLIQATTLTP